jgi:hypothetical protein
MFYTQCDNCNERWELGTASTCTCAIDEPVAWEQFYPEMGKPKLAYLPPTESLENACYIPPQRTWVGLTDEEKNSFWKADQMTQKEWDELFSDIEAKLKQKNT